MRTVARLRRSRVAEDAGLTLIEVMAAMVVFALVAAAATSLLLNSIGLSRNVRNRSVAASIAAQQLETLRNTSITAFSTIAVPAVATTTTTVGNQTYTVTQRTSWLSKTLATGSCGATGQGGGSTVQPVLLAQESVTWPSMGSTKPVTNATELTPPVGLYASNTGSIDVAVLDHANQPVSDVPVTFTSGASTTTVLSSSDGCALAAYLTPGTYTVSMTRSGYVDGQELTTSTQSVGVVGGTTATPTFYFDKAATLNATFAAPGGLTPATGLPITVYSTGLSGTGTFAFPSGVTSLTPLYPYPSYGIWAGRCPEADPSAVNASNNPLYSGGSRTTTPTTAGGATAVTVPLYPLNVTVKRGVVAINNAVLTLTELPGSSKYTCSGPYSTYGLVNTNSSGLSATGVPLGTFTLKAVSGTSTSTTVNVSLTGQTLTVSLP